MADEAEKGDSFLKKILETKWVLWAVALIALVLVCLTARIAFGSNAAPKPAIPQLKSHAATLPTSDQPLLQVVPDSDGDVAGTSAATPSTQGLNALQAQNTSTTPQSTTDANAAAAAQSLHAGAVQLQAGVTAGVDGLSINASAGLGL